MKCGKFEKTIPAFGIPELKRVMMEKCKNKLKKIVKKKMKDKFNQNIEEDYNKLISKINSKEFEPSLKEECEMIVKNLLGNININFNNLNNIITRYTNKDKMKEIKKNLFNNELLEEFNDISQKYGNRLSNLSMEEIYTKFDDYFNANIIQDIVNIYFEKASLIFIEKCKEFFGEIIGTNVRDEEYL